LNKNDLSGHLIKRVIEIMYFIAANTVITGKMQAIEIVGVIRVVAAINFTNDELLQVVWVRCLAGAPKAAHKSQRFFVMHVGREADSVRERARVDSLHAVPTAESPCPARSLRSSKPA
jgi:hypothetical protein